jgi:pre-rRNA-processing protein TSR4
MASTKVPEGPQEVVEAVDSDDDEGSASDDEDEDTNLQLGFVEELDEDEEPMFNTLDWTQWDGGKIGGAPCWLNPVHLPDPEAMACSFCQEPLSFLLQIYCPLDEPAAAYHRFLYVFCCRKGPCMDRGSVLALRCQLPVKNSYLAINPAHPDSVPPVVEPTRLCAVCGQRGPLT